MSGWLGVQQPPTGIWAYGPDGPDGPDEALDAQRDERGDDKRRSDPAETLRPRRQSPSHWHLLGESMEGINPELESPPSPPVLVAWFERRRQRRQRDRAHQALRGFGDHLRMIQGETPEPLAPSPAAARPTWALRALASPLRWLRRSRRRDHPDHPDRPDRPDRLN